MNSYFPLSIRFDNKKILLVGGGNIAHFKLQKIMQFKPLSLKCVARKISADFLENTDDKIEYVERDFDFKDLEGMDIVVVAVDNSALQKDIYDKCQELHILCNCVDLLECCDFIFPSIVKRGDITIAINSNGLLPGFSAALRNYSEGLIPKDVEKVFSDLVELRKGLSPGRERMQLIRDRAEKYFSSVGKK